MPHHQFAVIVLAVLLATSAVRAQTNSVAPASRSIDSLVAEALANNPELKFYEAEITAAQAGRKAAGSLANPELNGSVGRKTAGGSGLSAEGVAWSVSLVQPFEWPGRIGLRKAIANRDIELARLGYERFRAALAARVRTLAYTLETAQEKAEAAREVAERFKALREVLVQRDPAGLTPLLETRVIEATELTMQRRANEAALALQSARLELNQLRGVSPDTQMIPAPAPLTFRPVDGLEKFQTLARTNNFELRVRAVELAQQGFRVALAKNERYPTLSAGPTFSEENASDRERIIGVGISLPLPLWNRNTANIETARARQLQAEASFRTAEREVERRVAEAALTYQSKLRAMAQWRPDAVEHFRAAAEVADRHYRLGAVPVATYVELQQKYLDAVESLLDTKKEALEAAQTLELLTGLTPSLTASAEEKP